MKIKKNLPTILTCLGVGGVVATVITTINSTCKASELISAEKNEPTNEISDYVKKQIICLYLTPILVGVSTILCIIGSNVLNKKAQASILSAYSLLYTSFITYKERVKNEFGEAGDRKIRGNLAKQKFDNVSDKENDVWFIDSYLGMVFKSTTEQVQRAEYELNRIFILRGYASLHDFYTYLGISETSLARMFGWSFDIGADSGYEWVDFKHEKKILNDRGREAYLITYPFEPVINYI